MNGAPLFYIQQTHKNKVSAKMKFCSAYISASDISIESSVLNNKRNIKNTEFPQLQCKEMLKVSGFYLPLNPMIRQSISVVFRDLHDYTLILT